MHTRIAVTAGLLLLMAAPLAAQLPDLQPGRNYPTAIQAFGAGHSPNIDVGDADNDGDLDVAIANGNDSSPRANQIYINQGGAQGGTEGVCLDGTPTHYVGIPNDTSRDNDFADWDGDGDLDIFVSNRGNLANGGEVSRAYRNQGGAQLGSIGFFAEATDDFWGDLVAVPLAQEEGVQDGHGPFRDYSCDCDFSDLDDDGDLDLFHSSYGPSINGARDSRIFLNDGTGTFDELWPWADASADTKLHTQDIDTADFDGDFDIDIFAASRNSQARLYRNNLADDGWASDPFTDITQSGVVENGGALSGGSNYELEFGDLDADGDFDVWMSNYAGFTDRALENIGGVFHETQWIRGDPNNDEEDSNFMDYDGDGDLDVFVPNFSGTNFIYQSSLADGLPLAEGLLHRTGTGLSHAEEVPWNNNAGTTLDGQAADMDGDGDPDLLLCNDGNQLNRYWENVLGVPDTHAPVYNGLTIQADKSDGSDTVIHATLHDNEPWSIIAFHDVDLLYSVDGGPETCVQMSSMGGQQFRGVIPGELSGTISYRVEATDGAGNTGVSATTVYVQTSAGAPLWQSLGCGTTGVAGDPYLELSGAQVGGQPVGLLLRDAAPNAPFLLWLSFSSAPFSALGGEVFAFPFATQVLATTDAGGMLTASTTWPVGLPPGTEAWWQAIVQDSASIHGLVLSNAVHSTTP